MIIKPNTVLFTSYVIWD